MSGSIVVNATNEYLLAETMPFAVDTFAQLTAGPSLPENPVARIDFEEDPYFDPAYGMSLKSNNLAVNTTDARGTTAGEAKGANQNTGLYIDGFKGSSDFSISLWMLSKGTDAHGWAIINDPQVGGKWTYNGLGFHYHSNGSGDTYKFNIYGFGNGSWGYATEQYGPFNKSDWLHLIITRKDIWINGVKVPNWTFNGSDGSPSLDTTGELTAQSVYQLAFGNNKQYPQYENNVVYDDIFIYDRNLTDEEALQLFEAGATTKGPTSGLLFDGVSGLKYMNVPADATNVELFRDTGSGFSKLTDMYIATETETTPGELEQISYTPSVIQGGEYGSGYVLSKINDGEKNVDACYHSQPSGTTISTLDFAISSAMHVDDVFVYPRGGGNAGFVSSMSAIAEAYRHVKVYVMKDGESSWTALADVPYTDAVAYDGTNERLEIDIGSQYTGDITKVRLQQDFGGVTQWAMISEVELYKRLPDVTTETRTAVVHVGTNGTYRAVAKKVDGSSEYLLAESPGVEITQFPEADAAAVVAPPTLGTLVFHHGNFDDAHGDGDIVTALANGNVYADSPMDKFTKGTMSVVTTSDETTYTWTPDNDYIADALVVAGGGGGGGDIGGGGGAGGYLESSGVSVSGAQTIVVGRGGYGRRYDGHENGGSKGKNSSFGTMDAEGGGMAGAGHSTPYNAGSGGSGGGSNTAGGNSGPGSGVSGQGHSGGNPGGANSGGPAVVVVPVKRVRGVVVQEATEVMVKRSVSAELSTGSQVVVVQVVIRVKQVDTVEREVGEVVQPIKQSKQVTVMEMVSPTVQTVSCLLTAMVVMQVLTQVVVAVEEVTTAQLVVTVVPVSLYS